MNFVDISTFIVRLTKSVVNTYLLHIGLPTNLAYHPSKHQKYCDTEGPPIHTLIIAMIAIGLFGSHEGPGATMLVKLFIGLNERTQTQIGKNNESTVIQN